MNLNENFQEFSGKTTPQIINTVLRTQNPLYTPPHLTKSMNSRISLICNQDILIIPQQLNSREDIIMKVKNISVITMDGAN